MRAGLSSLMLLASLLATPLLGACQRGVPLDLSLSVRGQLADSRVLVLPVAVELIDATGWLHRLPLRRQAEIDLAAPAAATLPLPVDGRLRPGRYVGLRLVFADRAWFENAEHRRLPLAVDARGPFAALDIELTADQTRSLLIQLDLPASVPRQGPFQERLGFVPALAIDSR